MESSVRAISRPVIDHLPVNQIDEFTCRQLDRVRTVFLFVTPLIDTFSLNTVALKRRRTVHSGAFSRGIPVPLRSALVGALTFTT